MRAPSGQQTVAGVHLGATVTAVKEPSDDTAKRGGLPRFRAAEARNGVPEVAPYCWRACWDGSRRARLAADILARIAAGEKA